MAAHNADGWKEEMDKEMATLRSHDICEPVSRVKGLRTLILDWVLHRKFKNIVFDKIRPGQSPGVTTNVLGLTIMNDLPWRCGLSRSPRFSP